MPRGSAAAHAEAGGVAFSLWFVAEDLNFARIRQVDDAAKG